MISLIGKNARDRCLAGRGWLAVVTGAALLLTGPAVWGAGAPTPEVVGPDDVGSPLLALVLLLAGVALVCVGVWLALLGLAAAAGLGLVLAGVVSVSAMVAAGRKQTWAGRGRVFLRVASGLGGLLGGAGLGGLARVLWPQHLPLNWTLLAGATAGLGAGMLGATMLLWLLNNGRQWLEKRLEKAFKNRLPTPQSPPPPPAA